MSYKALARKWRPRTFDEVVGQPHAVTALSNALDSDRIHHAYLFTGTRGVGKTTIARIIAKALNCEKGVTSKPCGECGACAAIDEGAYVDLLEVDAASRTKVDDTRELLDNVQYRPTQGRYKIYLIDEVHMLSGHSFNALLKTLEEPPEHVKFLLATTDPQKLPATVLSRCLQFHLRSMDVEEIVIQLEKICKDENVEFETGALELLARSADGSMRDALSLLDQSIAFSDGKLDSEQVRSMLGMVDQSYISKLMENLIENDADAAMQTVADMSTYAVDYKSALDELMLLLHHIALQKQAPQALTAKYLDAALLTSYSERIDENDLQLYYQIALIGKRDIVLAPDGRSGFEMILLRMLAFHLEQPSGRSGASTGAAPAKSSTASPVSAKSASPKLVSSQSVQSITTSNNDNKAVMDNLIPSTEDEWWRFVMSNDFSGITKELAMNCALTGLAGDAIKLMLDEKHASLNTPTRAKDLAQQISARLGTDIRLDIAIGETNFESPAQREARNNAEEIEAARKKLEQDPNIQELISRFDASLVPESIKPGQAS